MLATLALAPLAGHTQTPAAPTLQTVDVVAPAPSTNGKLNLDAPVETGSRLGLTARETPASVTVVDRATIDARGAQDTQEILRAIPGVSAHNAPGSMAASYRGFTGNSVTQLYNGITVHYGSATRAVDSWIYDRVEAIGGTSSFLYGSGGVGGSLNYITKTAERSDFSEAQLRLGSYDLKEASVELNRRIAGTAGAPGPSHFVRLDLNHRNFDSGAAPLRLQAMNGGPLVLPEQAATVQALLSAASPNTRELRWVRAAGHTLVLAQAPAGAPALLDATTAAPHAWQPGAVTEAATHLLPHAVVRTETLTAYDLHYYDRAAHTMTGGGEKPLPVLRVVFDDPHATWVHIDPHTGAVLGRTDSHRRTSRWLFGMLHSWDWLPLLERRPLWDVVLIVLSLGGAAMSVTGVVIGWRRLGVKLRMPSPDKRAPQRPRMNARDMA